MAVLEHHAPPEPGQRRAGRPAPNLRFVHARHALARVHQRGREFPVVGQQDEPGGLQIQAPDGVEALAHVRDTFTTNILLPSVFIM
jgi:hypothetical protein